MMNHFDAAGTYFLLKTVKGFKEGKVKRRSG